MALIEIRSDPTRRELRQFALFWLPVFCAAVGSLLVYRYAAWSAAIGLGVCGLLAIVVGIVRPEWMRIVFVGWMCAAFPIGWTVSHLLMGMIYFLVITPIGLAMRLLGRDPLERRFDRTAETYWARRDERVDSSRYFRQF
jgi:hypothetical protein